MKSIKMYVLLPLMLFGFAAASKAQIGGPIGSGRFQKERVDMRVDLANIQASRASKEFWKFELKSDRKAGLKGDVIMDKKEIAKAKALESAAKRFLRADKTDFNKDYRLAIREQRRDVREAKQDLRQAKAEARKEVNRTYGSYRAYSAERVAEETMALNVETGELEDLKADFKSDKHQVKEEIKKGMK